MEDIENDDYMMDHGDYGSEIREMEAMESEIKQLLAQYPLPEVEGADGAAAEAYTSDIPPSAPVPHYLTPTFSSNLPPYLHGEVERVTNSFRSGSMWTLKKLPVKLEAGAITNSRRENMTHNLVPKPKAQPAKVKKDPMGCFAPVTHIGTVYEKDKWIQKCQADDERVRIEAFSRKPFMTTNRFVHKCEDSFGERAAYPLNILGPSTGVPDCNTLFREDLSRSTKFKAGPFRVNNPKNKEKTRKETEKWTAMVFKSLIEDWPHLRFKVRFTIEDEFLIQFFIGPAPERTHKAVVENVTTNSNASHASSDNSDEDSDSQKTAPTAVTTALLTINDRVLDIGTVEHWPQANAVHKYMNNIAFHGLPCKLGLRRRGDRWGVTERGPMPTNTEGKEKKRLSSLGGNSTVSEGGDVNGPQSTSSQQNNQQSGVNQKTKGGGEGSGGSDDEENEDKGDDDKDEEEEEREEEEEEETQSGSEDDSRKKKKNPTGGGGREEPILLQPPCQTFRRDYG